MRGRNAQLTRIFRLLQALDGAPKGFTAAELRARLEDQGHPVTQRTIYRDLLAIQDAGFPLVCSGDEVEASGQPSRYSLMKKTRLHRLVLEVGVVPNAA